MPVTRIEDEVNAVHRTDDLGGQRRAVDRAVRESEEFESDADSNRRRSVSHQGEPLTHRSDRPTTVDSWLSRRDDQKVLGPQGPANRETR